MMPEDYDILVLPGGRAPQKLRMGERVLDIAKHFFENSKSVKRRALKILNSLEVKTK